MKHIIGLLLGQWVFTWIYSLSHTQYISTTYPWSSWGIWVRCLFIGYLLYLSDFHILGLLEMAWRNIISYITSAWTYVYFI